MKIECLSLIKTLKAKFEALPEIIRQSHIYNAAEIAAISSESVLHSHPACIESYLTPSK